MWKNREPGGLSSDEFKNSLFSRLKEKGHVDALKARLRSCLVDELQKSHLSLLLAPKYFGDEEPLLFRAANSLVADHLRRCNFQYTLSVFLPESGTAHDQIFPVGDFLQLLHISPESKLYKKLQTKEISGCNMKGFLWQLLNEIAAEHGYIDRDHGAQADVIPHHPISSLDDKLTEVDQLYSARKKEVDHGGQLATEERILSYQKQLEDRSNMYIKMEISRFKENELARVKVEEREKYIKELEDVRKEMERAYQAKVSSLSERERNAIERLQKQQDGQEKDVYIQRQSILEEIETIRRRETQLKKEMQVNERERKLNEDKYRVTDELLRKREDAVKKLEDHFEKKFDEELTRFKFEEQAKYVHQLKRLEVREAKNQEDLKIINAEKESLKSVREKLQERRMQVNEFEMADYNYLKEENASLKKELETVKLRLAEVSVENERERRKQNDLMRDMLIRSGKPAPESLIVHRETENGQDAVKTEIMMAEYLQREVEQRLQQEISSSKQILKRFENQTLLQQQMQREIMELRHQLLHADHGLNNTSRNPMRSRAISQSKEESDMSYNDRQTSPNDYYDPTLGKSTPEPELMLLGDKFKHQDYIIGDSEDENFIHGMKNRLKDLEKEAETLEASYHSFQARMSNLYTGWPMESVKTTASKYKVVFSDSVANTLGIRVNNASMTIPNIAHGDQSIQTDCSKSSACSNLLPSFGLSTVGDNEEPVMTVVQDNYLRSLPVLHKRKTVTVDDLDARPGSPSVVIVPGSQTADTCSSQPTSSSQPEKDGAAYRDVSMSDFQSPYIHQTPECVSVPKSPPSSIQLPPLEDAWNTQLTPMTVSLDDTWKQETGQEKQQRESEVRHHNEAEETNWEEQRNQHEELMRKRDNEQRENERLEFEKLMKTEQSQKTSEHPPLKLSPSAKSLVAADESDLNKEQIDPVMKKYMEMVQQKKEKEKQVAKKTINMWNNNVPETTPSTSEQEFSVADDDKGHAADSDGFDW